MGKIVKIGPQARKEMLAGVDILANAVKATLGPRGRNVAIERDWGHPLITKDGVTVARNIVLDDRMQNMGAQLVRSVAAAANTSAGDGTTTATVLAQAIYGQGLILIDQQGLNPVLVKRGIDLAVAKLSARLKGLAAPVKDETSMRSVATISANNDTVLGQKIAEAIAAVGQHGVISVEEATGSSTEVFYSEGLRLDKGWASEHFVTNASKFTAELDDCLILPFDGAIASIHDAAGILGQISKQSKPVLFIVKQITDEALAQIVYNKVQGNLRIAVIRSPGFGDARRAFLEDIAIVAGGKMYCDNDGIGLKEAEVSELGVARRVIVSQNSTMIIEGGADQKDIEARVGEINQQIGAGGQHDYQIEILKNRLARITGAAAIFKVGGKSEAEMRERKDRVEDAINAVRSALEEGVVPGGGSSFIHALPVLDEIDTQLLLPEEIAGINIVREAVKAPFCQILQNAGVSEPLSYIERIISSNTPSGYDALRLEYVEDMLLSGIMDPCKVVRSALEHAASASGTLLTTEVAIYESDIIRVGVDE